MKNRNRVESDVADVMQYIVRGLLKNRNLTDEQRKQLAYKIAIDVAKASADHELEMLDNSDDAYQAMLAMYEKCSRVAAVVQPANVTLQ